MTTSTRLIPNRLLAALPRQDYRALLPQLEPVDFQFGDVLQEPGTPLKHVYFPSNSLVSLLTVVDQHLAIEVGMVGCEGLVGAPLALGIAASPVRSLVQGGGSALRMKASAFKLALAEHPALQKQVFLYLHSLMFQIAQTAACNRFHVIEARLARWLLMTRDRLGSEQFHLTHDFLGNMLGVRRVGVTNAAHHLKSSGLISYSRGDISILDDAGLEAASCSCYAATRLG